jgi:hypothetical protein
MPDPVPPAADGRSPLPRAAPSSELIDRRGTESVGGADDDAALIAAEELRELADRGRLADAVHTDHEHDGRTFGELERRVELREVLFERLAQHALEILGVRRAVPVDLLAKLFDDALADVGTEVRGDERRLEILPGRLVDGGLDEHAAQCATKRPGLLRHPSSLRVAPGEDPRIRRPVSVKARERGRPSRSNRVRRPQPPDHRPAGPRPPTRRPGASRRRRGHPRSPWCASDG